MGRACRVYSAACGEKSKLAGLLSDAHGITLMETVAKLLLGDVWIVSYEPMRFFDSRHGGRYMFSSRHEFSACAVIIAVSVEENVAILRYPDSNIPRHACMPDGMVRVINADHDKFGRKMSGETSGVMIGCISEQQHRLAILRAEKNHFSVPVSS